MKIKSKRRPPTFTKAGRVAMKVSIITCSDFCYLNSLNILAILRALITVVEDEPLLLEVK